MPSVQVNDKLIHGLMYALLSIAIIVPAAKTSFARVRSYLYVWIAATAYGGLMEILQHYCTLTRSGDMMDLLADALGALAGLILVAAVILLRTKHK